MAGRAGRLALIAHTLATMLPESSPLVRTGEGPLEPGGAWLHHHQEHRHQLVHKSLDTSQAIGGEGQRASIGTRATARVPSPHLINNNHLRDAGIHQQPQALPLSP